MMKRRGNAHTSANTLHGTLLNLRPRQGQSERNNLKQNVVQEEKEEREKKNTLTHNTHHASHSAALSSQTHPRSHLCLTFSLPPKGRVGGRGNQSMQTNLKKKNASPPQESGKRNVGHHALSKEAEQTVRALGLLAAHSPDRRATWLA